MSVTLLKPVYKNELENKIERIRVIDREIKKLSKTHAEIKAQICAEMGDQTDAYNSTGQIIATYTEQSSNTFDRARFDLAHPSEYENYTIKKIIKVFRLK